MAAEGTGRAGCVYTQLELNKNRCKMLWFMCIGIAIALYGIYVQARSASNPSYSPSLEVASSWMYHNVVHKVAQPTSWFRDILAGCGHHASQTIKKDSGGLGSMIMNRLMLPAVRYSGMANGMIHVLQICFLLSSPKSTRAAEVILAFSSLGLLVSALCLGGAMAHCRLIGFTCLGVHHMVIMWLAWGRRLLLKGANCPSVAAASSTAFAGGASGGAGGPAAGTSGMARRNSSSELPEPAKKRPSVSGQSGGAKPSNGQTGSHSSSCNSRLRRPTERRS